MFIMGVTDYPVAKPELKGTLWNCEKCHSFVSIHSAQEMNEALCPHCMDILEFCGTFDSLLGGTFSDA